MTESAARQIVKELIADTCAIQVTTVKDNGKLVGYGLDSARVLDLIMALEDELDIEISETDPELAAVETVRDLVEFVDRRLQD